MYGKQRGGVFPAAMGRCQSSTLICELVCLLVSFGAPVSLYPLEVYFERGLSEEASDVIDQVVVCFWSPFSREYIDGPLAIRVYLDACVIVL